MILYGKKEIDKKKRINEKILLFRFSVCFASCKNYSFFGCTTELEIIFVLNPYGKMTKLFICSRFLPPKKYIEVPMHAIPTALVANPEKEKLNL